MIKCYGSKQHTYGEGGGGGEWVGRVVMVGEGGDLRG